MPRGEGGGSTGSYYSPEPTPGRQVIRQPQPVAPPPPPMTMAQSSDWARANPILDQQTKVPGMGLFGGRPGGPDCGARAAVMPMPPPPVRPPMPSFRSAPAAPSQLCRARRYRPRHRATPPAYAGRSALAASGHGSPRWSHRRPYSASAWGQDRVPLGRSVSAMARFWAPQSATIGIDMPQGEGGPTGYGVTSRPVFGQSYSRSSHRLRNQCYQHAAARHAQNLWGAARLLNPLFRRSAKPPANVAPVGHKFN
jgi:hypothetical protein